MSAGKRMTEHERHLRGTQTRVNAVYAHIRVLVRRFEELEQLPGEREQMTWEQKVEYNLMGGLFSDVRSAVARVKGEAA